MNNYMGLTKEETDALVRAVGFGSNPRLALNDAVIRLSKCTAIMHEQNDLLMWWRLLVDSERINRLVDYRYDRIVRHQYLKWKTIWDTYPIEVRVAACEGSEVGLLDSMILRKWVFGR